MSHFAEPYAGKLNQLLHTALSDTKFYKIEIIDVPGLLTAILVTYDNVRDDVREPKTMTWEEFLKRMSIVKADWAYFDINHVKALEENPERMIGGWEGRTIYFFRGGNHPEIWTSERAFNDVFALMASSIPMWGKLIEEEVNNVLEIVPAGNEHFHQFETVVRVTLNYIFLDQIGEGQAQSRTAPEDEGLEIRDIVYRNKASGGFWGDLKQKYLASEIIFDSKNKDEIDRDDLRQLYCYLKPALGFWGFIVCRSDPPSTIEAFNRKLFQNFSQARGVLILSVADLRRMVEIKKNGRDPSAYLAEKMSKFVRSI